MKLDGKVALITGGGGGMGGAQARLFARAGAPLCVADLFVDKAERVASEIQAGGGRALGVDQNLNAHPNTRIEVGSETIDVVAEETTGDQRDRLFAKAAEHYPQFADTARKTERVIPMILLTPRPRT